jgi:hypothetical protein
MSVHILLVEDEVSLARFIDLELSDLTSKKWTGKLSCHWAI